MKYDKRLENLVDVRNPETSFDKVCDEIDEILSENKQQSRILRGLICHYEAQKSREESVNYIITILYAVLIAVMTILASFNNVTAMMMVIYLGFTMFVIICGFGIDRRNEYKCQFVLSCLKYKDEELYSKFQTLSGDQSEEYKEYIVGVKGKNK